MNNAETFNETFNKLQLSPEIPECKNEQSNTLARKFVLGIKKANMINKYRITSIIDAVVTNGEIRLICDSCQLIFPRVHYDEETIYIARLYAAANLPPAICETADKIIAAGVCAIIFPNLYHYQSCVIMGSFHKGLEAELIARGYNVVDGKYILKM